MSKRWNALSYHRVREAVAAGFLRFHFIGSKDNPADIMTKPLDHAAAWPHVDPLLFRKGDTLSRKELTALHAFRGVTSGKSVADPQSQVESHIVPVVFMTDVAGECLTGIEADVTCDVCADARVRE